MTSLPNVYQGGTKNDKAKDPWHLAPWDAVRSIVKVLAFGANKYTFTDELSPSEAVTWIVQQWQGISPALAIRINSGTAAMDDAGTVTNVNSVPRTLSSQSDSVRTVVGGVNSIPTAFGNTPNVGSMIHTVDTGTMAHSGVPASGTLELTKSNSTNFESTKEVAAVSVAMTSTQSLDPTSITVTRPDGCEASFAVDATTASASLKTLWSFFKEQSGTSKILPTVLFDETPNGRIRITVSGERNWERGMSWSRVYRATIEHMNSWWMGEDLDPETGFSHLAHAGCCILFLIAFEIRGIGKDDRPKMSESS